MLNKKLEVAASDARTQVREALAAKFDFPKPKPEEAMGVRAEVSSAYRSVRCNWEGFGGKQERILKELEMMRDSITMQAAILHCEVEGIGQVKGDVLEIGGAPGADLEAYFLGVAGARSYTNVRLEPNKERNPNVVVANFMNLEGEGKYDLIVAIGVFEDFGVDRKVIEGRMDAEGMMMHRFKSDGVFENFERLEKLFSLLKGGGALVIGTSGNPCIFENWEIERAGFSIEARRRGFGLVDEASHELLILHKLPKPAHE